MNEYYLHRKLIADREESERRAYKHLIEQEALARQGTDNEKAQSVRRRFWFAHFQFRLPRLFTHRSRQPLCTTGAAQVPFN